jgi:hypothetical protein
MKTLTLALGLLLTGAAPAAASCTWIAWATITIRDNQGRLCETQISPEGAFGTKQECLKYAMDLAFTLPNRVFSPDFPPSRNEAQDTYDLGTTCLPDTVDPRPKGAAR